MTTEDLQYLRAWFYNYADSFYLPDEDDQRNMALKKEHTENVCRNIMEIADGLGLADERKMLAETIALFHDVGRFPQYAEYRTFRDADSVNHGLLAAKTLIQENVLERLPLNEQDLITRAVKFHNAFSIPTVMDEDTVFFLKLVRDADKLDIFRVFINYYESPEEERASATAFGVPDTPEYSKEIMTSLLDGKVASYSLIRTENDFRLMKLSWVYALYFDVSVRILEDRGYIEKLLQLLPRTDEIKTAVSGLREYISERLGNHERK